MVTPSKLMRIGLLISLLLGCQGVLAANSSSHSPNDYLSPTSPKKILLVTTLGDSFTIIKYQPIMHGYIYQVQPIDRVLTQQLLAGFRNRGNHVRAVNLPTHNFLNSTDMTYFIGSHLSNEGQAYLEQLTSGMDIDVILLVIPETPGKPSAWTGYSTFSIDMRNGNPKFLVRYKILQIDAYDYHIANMESYTLGVKLPSNEIDPNDLNHILYSMNNKIAYSIMRVFESMESALGVAYGSIPVSALQTPE